MRLQRHEQRSVALVSSLIRVVLPRSIPWHNGIAERQCGIENESLQIAMMVSYMSRTLMYVGLI